MNFLTTPRIKISVCCILTGLTLILTACDDKTEEPQEVTLTLVETNKTNAGSVELDIQEVDNLLTMDQLPNKPKTLEELEIKPIEQISDNIDIDMLAVSLSKSLAIGFNYQLVNNSQWTEDEKECFGKINDDFVVTELKKILKAKLNEEELQQATKFYQSSAGKELKEWQNVHLQEVMINKNISVNDMGFDEEDLLEIAEFMQSSSNMKINQFIESPQIEQLIAEKIAPQLFACGMAEKD